LWERPVHDELIRIGTQAGHGASERISKLIE
jgi:hypothetical protein